MSKRRRIEATILIGMLFIGALGMNFVSTAIASDEATVTEAVHFSTLIAFLPDAPSGWDGEEPFGMMYTIQDGTWSMATESYTKSGAEDTTAEVGVMDSAFYQVGWLAAWQGFYAYESTEGYAKTVTVDGYPAWVAYTKDSGEYTLFVGINDRFMVFISTNSDEDTLYDFANAIDYNGIAALGGGAAPPPAGTAEPAGAATKAPTAATEDGGETPGFETVFAVVGLLAVMALLRRRG
jgi:PGF-CTERM protein